MLKEKTTELLPSDPEELTKALTAEGVAPDVIEHFLGVKAAYEAMPTCQRTATKMGHA
jgi:hypothetical protein